MNLILQLYFYQTKWSSVLLAVAIFLCGIGAQRLAQRWKALAPKVKCGAKERATPLRQDTLREICEEKIAGIFQTTPDGRFLSANPAGARMHGYDSPEEMLASLDGLANNLYVDPTNRQELVRLLTDHGTVENFEFQAFCKDGGTIWISTNARAICDAAGTVLYYVGTTENVTKRKRVEKELQEQRAFLRQIIDISPNLIFVKDRAGRFTLVNQALADAYSRSVEEIIGKTDWEIGTNLEEANCFRQDDLEVVSTQREKFIAEESNTDSQGRVRWFQVVKRPLVSEDGKSISLLGVATDITERKRTEIALETQRAFLRKVIDTSPSFIFVKDQDCRFVLVNQALADTYSRSVEEIIGKTDWEIGTNRQEAEVFRRDDLEVINTGREKRIAEEQITDGQGQVRWLQTVKLPIFGKDATVSHLLGVATDITDRKLLEDQLRQAQKMEAVGQLAGGIAHDFNNILVGNLAYSELMMRQLDVKGRLYPMAKSIRDASLRARELTRRLLAFSREQVREPQALHLNALISNMSDILNLVIGENVMCVRHLDSHLHVIKADPIEIEQVILNLVKNASDAMPSGGTVTLRVSNVELTESFFRHDEPVNPGAWIVLEVSDTGCGMDQNTISHIFDPFFTTKDVAHGSGLGLAIVRGCVRQSGGLIRVQSETGKGTKFRIYLPRTTERVRGKLPQTTEPEALRGSETILVVDDDGMVRQVLFECLADLGYKVMAAKDGQEAFRVAANYAEPIGLLLTDLVMPGMDGPELAQRHILMHPESKVLFISGYPGRSGDIADLASDARYAFLSKPFAPDSLAGLVRTLLTCSPDRQLGSHGSSCI